VIPTMNGSPRQRSAAPAAVAAAMYFVHRLNPHDQCMQACAARGHPCPETCNTRKFACKQTARWDDSLIHQK
jgi:hypothetical protein